ncbi:hypothetical protein CPS_1292 [Colwellia psychrerythraea 34H]|uniref:Uncharacterized protein n=1 Tax=Colwellia psychrerythraea (strain 34H / ATCC BAA-681) TaxID=167879 RepID=Q486I0_COLP3|nr:hypothetical protein CPS_1292 [Colwellia psychrerythraea 34H]
MASHYQQTDISMLNMKRMVKDDLLALTDKLPLCVA